MNLRRVEVQINFAAAWVVWDSLVRGIKREWEGVAFGTYLP